MVQQGVLQIAAVDVAVLKIGTDGLGDVVEKGHEALLRLLAALGVKFRAFGAPFVSDGLNEEPAGEYQGKNGYQLVKHRDALSKIQRC